MSVGRFVAVYRWSIDPAHEAAFAHWWREGTDALREAGSFGSSLIRESEGTYIGIAIWPDRATRDHAFVARAGAPAAPGLVRFEEIATGTDCDTRWTV